MARPPPGLERGSLFGQSITTLALYLHYTQAISLERLRWLFGEVFGLETSEGALVNIFRRARARGDADRGRAEKDPGQPRDLFGRDLGAGGRPHEMGVGFRGRGHRAARTGGEPRQEPAGARPEVWVVDPFGSRQAQVCLAHQVRDGHYASDAIFASAMLEFPHRAVRLGRERAQLKDRTMQRHRRNC